MRILLLLAVTCVMLLARTAHADEPEPTPIFTSPPPPPVVAQRQSALPHDPEVRPPRGPRRDPALFGVGLTASIVGGTALLTGASIFVLTSTDLCSSRAFVWFATCDQKAANAGLVMALAGAVVFAIGLPLAIHNGKRLPPTSSALSASATGLALAF